jgi:hypothetical protein
MSKKRIFLKSEFDAGPELDHRLGVVMERDILQARCKLLNPTDQILFRLAAGGHFTYAQMAALAGISVSSLTHRIRRLTSILSRQYPELFRPSQKPGALDWKITRMACLQDQSIRAIARRTGLSLYQIRKIVSELKMARYQMKNQ